jgi:hypothetical protein
LFYLFCLLLALTFSFWRQKEKGNKKKKPPSAVSDRLRSFARRKRRNSLRSNSLRFFSPCSASPLFGPKLRTGFFWGGCRSSPLAKSLWGVFASLFFDPFFCFGASFGAKSLRSFVLFLVPLLVILFGKVGISLPAKVSWSL